MLAGDRTAAARQRWRKLRTAAFILRMLRSRSPISTSAPRKSAPFRESLLSEYSPERKMLLTRALAKPFWSRSEVDVKLLAELLRQCKFSPHLSSASHDALAQVLQIRMLHDGEIVFRQGDAVEEMSERFLVICGSLLVFSRDKESDDDSRSSADHDGFGELIDICNPGTSCGEDATLGAIVRKTTVLAQRTTSKIQV
ncbi:hypothetical protein PHYBOEH_011676 [Phytophthora boehmeriae]|uniref:Cyclic nucleotide-binding domain-containing protein n=1 Tax=Phytophthora boehmeriae TaxID=109152 RepID=A0A8T1X372_9STRA|nr:hypothetical protein PHYBOEH_011676 [Phytophthora boehmeriae]